MREVRIGPRGGNNSSNPHFVALGEEMDRLRKKPGRVFYIHSSANGKPCVLTMTAGNLLLELSRLSAEGREHLCSILVEESAKNEENDGIIVSRNDSGTNMYVTSFHQNETGYIFHLSPTGGRHDHHDGEGGVH